MFGLGNWIKQSVSAGGTGNLTVASVTGFDTFASQFGDASSSVPGLFFDYVIQDGNDWESGVGHMADSTTLVRDLVKMKIASGTMSRFPATGLTVSTSAVVFCDLNAGTEDAPFVRGASSLGISDDRRGRSTLTVTMTANYTFAWPVRVPFSALYKQIIVHCTTAGGGTKWQFGIYQSNTSGEPGQLIARTGDTTPATGNVAASWSTAGNIYIRRGWYWLVWSGDGAPVFTTMNQYGGIPYWGGGWQAGGILPTVGRILSLTNPLPQTAPSFTNYDTSLYEHPIFELVTP